MYFSIICMEEINFILDPHCRLLGSQCLEKENQKNMVSEVFLLTYVEAAALVISFLRTLNA